MRPLVFSFFQGVAVEQGDSITVAATDLDDLVYVAGPVVNVESISVRVSDGTLASSALVRVYTVRPESVRRPVVQVDNTTILGNESILASEFIRAFDPDGFPITSYTIRDRIDDRSFFSLDGEELTQGVFHRISANEFDRLVYNAVGRRSENIDVFAFDGTINSEFTTGVASVRANLNRPVIQFAGIESAQGEIYALSDLVSAFDSDGNTIKFYEFKDRNSRSFSGSLIFNGQELAAGEFHRFTAEQLDDVFYAPGSRNITEQVRYRVGDGRFRSGFNTIEFDNSSIEQGGVLEVEADNIENSVVSHLQTLPVSDLFEIVDSLALESIEYH